MIKEDKKEPDVQPEDSVSHVSCSSTSRASSTATTTSSTHAQARAAGLAVAAAALQTEQCMEWEEQALRQHREPLILQTDIAIAEAEAKVYEADEAKQSDVNKTTASRSIRKRAPLQLLFRILTALTPTRGTNGYERVYKATALMHGRTTRT